MDDGAAREPYGRGRSASGGGETASAQRVERPQADPLRFAIGARVRCLGETGEIIAVEGPPRLTNAIRWFVLKWDGTPGRSVIDAFDPDLIPEQRCEQLLRRDGCVKCGKIILADSEDWGPMCPDHHDEFVEAIVTDAQRTRKRS